MEKSSLFDLIKPVQPKPGQSLKEAVEELAKEEEKKDEEKSEGEHEGFIG